MCNALQPRPDLLPAPWSPAQKRSAVTAPTASNFALVVSFRFCTEYCPMTNQVICEQNQFLMFSDSDAFHFSSMPFCTDKKLHILINRIGEHPDLSIGDVTKKLGEMWNNTAADDKQPYEKKAAKLKEKYEKDIAAYRAKGKPDAAKKGVVKAEKSKKKKEEEDEEDEEDEEEEEEEDEDEEDDDDE
ncbi:hypothetical protein STEG23_033715 [Scotinomys teguina]